MAFDIVFRGATVFDGSGAEPATADIGVADGRIARIGGVPRGAAGEEIDAAGLALCPGFIDVHTHDDRAVFSTGMEPKISQGVTTVVVGNCGISLAPLVPDRAPPPPPLDLIGDRDDYAFPDFSSYLDRLDEAGLPLNAVALCGHATLRVGVMDRLDRPASAAEIGEMRRRLEDALAAGAAGFSTGLDYPPARAAPREEVEALASLCAACGGLHATHMRDESDRVLEAMEEAFAIGRNAGVPVLVSHFKCSGRRNWGRSAETLARFEAARRDQDVSLDMYPYAASSTVLKLDYAEEAERVTVTWSKSRPEAAGRDLAEIAREWGVSMAEAVERLKPAGAVYFAMDEADVRRILAYPHTMIGSDGLPHDAHPHPRLWGTFPRVLGHYARDLGLFPLAEAVRRMTGLPAARFGLADRGRIAVGACADLVLFDPSSILDTATFEEPARPAAGVAGVWVNGVAVWRHGEATGERPGRPLRRAA